VSRADRLLEACRVEVAVLEGVVVALDCALDAGDLLGKRGALFGERRAVAFFLGGRVLDCLADEVPVAVEVGELGEDCVLQLVLREPFAVAGFAAELLSA
jgi:hypothetical protein